ncbi:MAG: triosephosphate isomerase [Patescibacteria group bacterium]|nr:MAG: triosephosphate isomerase [Patescibacteria group bacterium]
MKEFYIIANWKAKLNLSETASWLNDFKKQFKQPKNKIKIILAPTATALFYVSKYCKQNSLDIEISSQDVSRFAKGAYTGESPAEIIKDFVNYSIIGHSERRRLFNETTPILSDKLKQCRLNNIRTIYCIENLEDELISEADLIAFEPKSAIGTGNNLEPEKLHQIKKTHNQIKKPFLYGGSISLENIEGYFKIKGLVDGFLISSASKDPIKFLSAIDLIDKALDK